MPEAELLPDLWVGAVEIAESGGITAPSDEVPRSYVRRHKYLWWAGGMVAAIFVALAPVLQQNLGDRGGRATMYLLGLAVGCVLLLFLAWAEHHQPWVHAHLWSRKKWRSALTALVSCTALAAFLLGAQADPARASVKEPPVVRELGSSTGMSTTIDERRVRFLPRFSQRLTGSTQAPISLIFLGSGSQLLRSFQHAGWEVAGRLSPRSACKAIVCGAFDLAYPDAPVTPVFLDGKLQDLAFNHPDGYSSRKRHHVRWWLTDFTVEGRQVWVATASLDVGVGINRGFPLPIHHIHPDIDAERDYIATSLLKTQLTGTRGMVRVCSPMRGKNAAGDHFFTEGKARVLAWRGSDAGATSVES